VWHVDIRSRAGSGRVDVVARGAGRRAGGSSQIVRRRYDGEVVVRGNYSRCARRLGCGLGTGQW